MTYIKENIITKLQKLCSLTRNLRAGNKSPALFLKKPVCTGNLSPMHKIFIAKPMVITVLTFLHQVCAMTLKKFYLKKDLSNKQHVAQVTKIHKQFRHANV